MSAIRLMIGTVLLASALGSVSCDFSQGSKVVRKGVATEDSSLVSRLEAGLKAAGVSHEVSKTQDGLLSVTWEAADDEKSVAIEVLFLLVEVEVNWHVR